MKKIVAVLLNIAMMISLCTVNVYADQIAVTLDIPIVDHINEKITINGGLDHYTYSYWNNYSATITVLAEGASLQDAAADSSLIFQIAECKLDKKGRFSYTFQHNFKSVSDSCTVFVNVDGIQAQTVGYTISHNSSYQEIFEGNTIMCAESPVYFADGVKYETESIPYVLNGSIYLPAQELANALGDDKILTEDTYINSEELAVYGKAVHIFKNLGIVCIGKDISERQASSIRMEFGIHVTADGYDYNDGSAANPVATINRAMDIAKYMAGEKDIFVHAGIYEETLNITSEYNNIRIKGVGDVSLKPPTLKIAADSFTRVTDTEVLAQLPYYARGHVLCADISGCTDDIAGISNFIANRNKSYYKVYQDGFGMTNARWPNGYDFALTTAAAPDMHDKLTYNTEIIYFDNPEKLALWKNAENAHAYIYRSSGYNASEKKIVGIDEEEKTVTFDYRIASGQRIGDRFYIYNLLQELDVPGEYYIDAENQKLYLFPTDSFLNIEIITSAENVVNISNSSGITVENMKIGKTRGNGIVIADSDHVNIKACEISGIGIYGLLGQRCTETTIDSCIVNDTSDGGILLNYSDAIDPDLQPQHNSIKNCRVYNVGTDNPIAGAVYMGGTGNTMQHNTIHDTPHMAIWFGGNDNTVEYNEIYNALKYCDDAGVIYGNPGILGQGNIVQYNYIHDCITFNNTPSELYFIYLDWNTSGITVSNNLFEIPQTESPFAFGLFGGGRNNTLDSNVFVGDSCFVLSNRYEQGSMHDNLISSNYLANFINGLSEAQRSLWFEKYPSIEDEYNRYTNDDDYTDVGLPLECIVTDNVFADIGMNEERAFFWRKAKWGYDSTKKYAKDFSGNCFADSTDTSDLPAKKAGCSLENNTKAVMLWPQDESTIPSGKQRLVWHRNGAESYTVRIAESANFQNCVFSITTAEDYADVELPEGTYYLDFNGEVIQFTVSDTVLMTSGGNGAQAACDGILYLILSKSSGDHGAIKDSVGNIAVHSACVESSGDKTMFTFLPDEPLSPRQEYGVYVNEKLMAEFRTKDIVTVKALKYDRRLSADIMSELERITVDAQLVCADKNANQLVGITLFDIAGLAPAENKSYLHTCNDMADRSELYIWDSLSGMRPLTNKLAKQIH